jgi:exodeoxyribonuclease VII small subunit
MATKPPEKSADAALPAFEEAIDQVQRIIDAIEGGQVPLEQSLDQYASGMKLIRHCRSVLDRAEQKIKQLTIDDQGNVVESGEVKTTE